MAGCGDVLSLEDLQTAKKHQIFEAEVITGKVGGVAGGAAIDYATNQVTGQTQKTLPAVLRDTGFRPASFTFATGGTLAVGDSDVVVLWPISSGGDGQYYLWKGGHPKVVPAASSPDTTGGVSDAGWLPWGDITLREDLASSEPGKGVDLVAGAVKSAILASSDGAGSVGFSQETAYLPASVGFRLAHAVYITDAPFNAVANVTTDQTPAIQAAIDYAYTFEKPKTIVIPHGTFSVNGGLNFPAGKTPHVMGLGEASVLQRQVGSTKHILTFNDNFYLNDLFFAGAADGGLSKAVKGLASNTAKLDRNYFQLQDVGVELNASFAVELTSNVFDVCKLYGVVSTSACHNIVLRNNNFFTCGVASGGQAISIQSPTDNIVIDGNDFEYCNVNVRLNGATAVRITGNYMEYHKSACFDFLGTQYGVAINHNWIALGDASGGGAVQNLGNIVGGEFIGNTIYNQTINFSDTLSSFDVGANAKTGTGTLGKTPFIVPGLLNSWTQQTNYSLIGYRKDNRGYVHIKGAVVGGTGQTIIFTLPVGYRPTDGNKTFSCASASGACTIIVGTNGNVVPLTAVGNNPGLDGISFYVG